MATTRGEKPRGPVKKKARPSKAHSRFRECATHDCLKIHSFIRRLDSAVRRHPSPRATRGIERLLFTRIHTHTRAMLAPVRALYTEDILHGYDEN